jgi:hypothetical protein
MEKAGEKRLKAVPWKPLQGARSERARVNCLTFCRERLLSAFWDLTETDGEAGRWPAQEGPE